MSVAQLFKDYLYGNPMTAGHVADKADGIAFALALEAVLDTGGLIGTYPLWRLALAVRATYGDTGYLTWHDGIGGDPTTTKAIKFAAAAPVTITSELWSHTKTTFALTDADWPGFVTTMMAQTP